MLHDERAAIDRAYAETAARMGWSVETLRRAVKVFRQCLADVRARREREAALLARAEQRRSRKLKPATNPGSRH
jgi:hypothetical protein